jgi:hypothetical protein
MAKVWLYFRNSFILLAVRRNLYVGGFQIPVHDAFFVCSFERFADVLGNVESLLDRNWYAFDTVL